MLAESGFLLFLLPTLHQSLPSERSLSRSVGQAAPCSSRLPSWKTFLVLDHAGRTSGFSRKSSQDLAAGKQAVSWLGLPSGSARRGDAKVPGTSEAQDVSSGMRGYWHGWGSWGLEKIEELPRLEGNLEDVK